MINWKRVARTAVQVGCGAMISFINAIAQNWNQEAVMSSAITLCTTVLIAVLMNIKTQVEEIERPEEENRIGADNEDK